MIAAYLRWMPDLAARRNPVRVAWDALQGKPGGTRLFLAVVRAVLPAAPPRGLRVADLRPGFAAVELGAGREGRAEVGVDVALLTAHLAVSYALADGLRPRPTERSWAALRVAQGAVTVTATLREGGVDGARWTVGVEARDATGDRCGVGELSFEVAGATAS